MFFLLVLAVSIFHAAPLSDFPDHAWMRQANAGAVALSPVSTPPDWVHPMKPTVDQPIEWAFVELSPASPSVEDRVSNLHVPVFFWMWGERHASTLSDTYVIDPECGASTISISEFGAPRVEGTLVWSLAGQSASQSFDSHSAQPVQSPLPNSSWQNLNTTQGENGSAILPPLLISMQGRVVVPYMQEREEHYLVTYTDSHGNTVSHCETNFVSQLVDYSLSVGSQRAYGVEHGEPLFLKLRPADREQLSPSSIFERADISNRRPYESDLALGSAPISSSRYAHYALEKDSAGFWSITRKEITGADTQWKPAPPGSRAPNSNAPLFPPSLSVNSTDRFLQPAELDAANRSYAYQYFQGLHYPFPLGPSTLVLRWSDDFMDNWSASFPLLTHAPAAIVGVEASNARAQIADVRAAAPPANAQNQTGLLQASLPVSQNWRDTSASFFPPGLLPLGIGTIFIAALGLWLALRLRGK
ncbi:Uncharacterised protein [uncultured archaeon]|nr:Uncharacterised protein [uncultured archaeon]